MVATYWWINLPKDRNEWSTDDLVRYHALLCMVGDEAVHAEEDTSGIDSDLKIVGDIIKSRGFHINGRPVENCPCCEGGKLRRVYISSNGMDYSEPDFAPVIHHLGTLNSLLWRCDACGLMTLRPKYRLNGYVVPG